MSELHAIAGASLLTFGAATFSYIMYKLHTRNQSSKDGPIMILLSEATATIIIGAIQFYCFKLCEECSDDIIEKVFNQTMIEDCIEKINCFNRKMYMDQLALTVTAIHCFVSLITTSTIYKNFGRNSSTKDQPSTSTKTPELTSTHLQETIGSILAQWLLPILSASILFYVMNETSNKICSIEIPENFQTLVSEIIDQPINSTEMSAHETEFNDIVGKVYSIVESATKSNPKDSNIQLDEGFNIYNILERLNTPNHRTPKEIKPDVFRNISYKIYMILFMLLVFFVPAVYSNQSYMKLKMSLKLTEDELQHLKISMISAGVLWTPSIAEMFTRTYITENEPTIVMHALMMLGSFHILIKNGMNLKLLKSFTGQKNTITPEV